MIKDLRVLISKLDTCKVSKTSGLNSKISIDSTIIEVNDYTESTLKRFHKEIVNDYKHELHRLEGEYKSLIFSPEEAFEKALLDAEKEQDDEKDEKR